jgi:hypothetical protein
VFCVDSSESELGILDLIQVNKVNDIMNHHYLLWNTLKLYAYCRVGLIFFAVIDGNSLVTGVHFSTGVCGNSGQML